MTFILPTSSWKGFYFSFETSDIPLQDTRYTRFWWIEDDEPFRRGSGFRFLILKKRLAFHIGRYRKYPDMETAFGGKTVDATPEEINEWRKLGDEAIQGVTQGSEDGASEEGPKGSLEELPEQPLQDVEGGSGTLP